MKNAYTAILALLLVSAPAAAYAQYAYTTNADNTLTITGYTGVGGALTIPTNIDGQTVSCIGDGAFTLSLRSDTITSITMPDGITSIGNGAFEENDLMIANTSLTNITIPVTVTNMGNSVFAFCLNLTSASIPNGITSIGDNDFFWCQSLASITIPDSVTSIGEGAFTECYGLHTITIPAGVTSIGMEAFEDTGLTAIYFKGNSPSIGESAFYSFFPGLIVYYLLGITGWASFAQLTGVPTALWNPSIQASGASFGVRNNQFGFNITGTTNIPIVVEACTNLASPVWVPLQSLLLTNGLIYFSESFQANSSGRFYRIGSP
jgi:hypothetical protein